MKKVIVGILSAAIVCTSLTMNVSAEEQGETYAGFPSVEITGEYSQLDEDRLVNGTNAGEAEDRQWDYAVSAEGDEGQNTGKVADGALAAGEVYNLPEELLDYQSVYVTTRQYPCPERNGVYFLQSTSFYFLDMTTGQYESIYKPTSSDVYSDGKIMYWNEDGTIVRYDMVGQCMLEPVTLDVYYSTAIGVDLSGRFYVYGRRNDADKNSLLLYSSEGSYLSSIETEGSVYEFIGFKQDGIFFYEGYHNWIYWGYEHDMDALFTGKVSDNTFDETKFGFIGNLGQHYYSEHQDYADLLSEDLLADHLGDVYDISDLDNMQISAKIVVSHEKDEPSDSWGDTSSIGCRMVYDKNANILTAYTSGRNLFQYDLSTGEILKKYTTKYFVFNLLDYGDWLIAIEKEQNHHYIEIIHKADLRPIETTVINLNERDIYKTHTKEAVKQRYEAAKISNDLKVYESEYTLTPYKESPFTEETRNALLEYSNYMRWLGGLTPFVSSPDEIWREEAKGALLLTQLNELTHSPAQPSDMDDAFYQSAYNACSNSNLYGGGVSEGRASSLMYYVDGWLDDTANISSYELGHRFEFLQRSGYALSYGGTNRYLAQRVEVYDNQINATGTVVGVDNNDYCYTWPGAGYFPTEHLDTRALWSVGLNRDLIDLSTKPLTVTIEDLDTGEVTDVSESLGTSAYMGSGWGYFKGMFFYFNPPSDSDYSGKSYKVTLANLALPSGDPASIEYTVNFFDVNSLRGDVDGNGNVDISDLRLLLRAVCNKVTLNEQQEANADVEADGQVNIQDLRKLLRYICGKITEL